MWYKGTFKNGKLDGYCEIYTPNKQLQFRCFFENGKINKHCIFYTSNGELYVKYKIKNNIIYNIKKIKILEDLVTNENKNEDFPPALPEYSLSAPPNYELD